jgi:hypothetical protein
MGEQALQLAVIRMLRTASSGKITGIRWMSVISCRTSCRGSPSNEKEMESWAWAVSWQHRANWKKKGNFVGVKLEDRARFTIKFKLMLSQ